MESPAQLMRNYFTGLVSPIFDVVPIFGLIGLLITSSSASAATFYVAKNGNDNNSGTLAQPFLTIAQGIAALGSGDTLLIRTGVYNESIITGWPVYQNLASGTSWTNATTIAAYQDEEVILRPYGGGGIIDFKSDEPSGFLQYVIIDRLILDGINAGSVGVNIQGGPHHIRLQNCEIKNTYSNGVSIFVGNNNHLYSNHNEIINCDIHDIGRAGGTCTRDDCVDDNGNAIPNGGQYPDTAPGFGRAHAFYISTSDNIFDGNRVYHAGQYGFHIFNSKRIEFPFHRNIVRNNLIYDNAQGTTRYGHRSGAGIILSGGSGSIAYNNVIWGHTVGISVGYGAVDVTVVHNTLYNNTVGISVGNEWSPTTDTYVANNLLVSNVVGVNISGIVSGTTIERNLLYLSPGILDAGESTQQRDNLLDIDPQLVNTNAHDFTPLSKNSPVVDAAIHLSSAGLEFDHNHQPRPQGNGPDIGAIEFQESTQTPPPPPPSILEYTIMRASAPPVIDGDPREFTGATEIVLAQKTTNTEATYWLLWDDDALYVAAHVVDESLEAVGTESIDPLWSDDSLELFLDTQHNRGSRLDADDFKFFVTATNVQSTHPLDAVAFLSAVTTGGEINSSADKDQGYWLEMRVRWQDMGVAAPTAGGTWGFDIVNNDRADGERSIAAWASDPESGLNNPDGWGTLRFSNATIDLCHSPTAEICNDGIDNDCDGAVDGADTTCNISGTCADETACIDDDMCCPAGCAGSDSDCPVTGNADVLCTDNAAGSKDCTSVVTTQGCSGATGSSVTLFCLALGLLKRRRRRV